MEIEKQDEVSKLTSKINVKDKFKLNINSFFEIGNIYRVTNSFSTPCDYDINIEEFIMSYFKNSENYIKYQKELSLLTLECSSLSGNTGYKVGYIGLFNNYHIFIAIEDTIIKKISRSNKKKYPFYIISKEEFDSYGSDCFSLEFKSNINYIFDTITELYYKYSLKPTELYKNYLLTEYQDVFQTFEKLYPNNWDFYFYNDYEPHLGYCILIRFPSIEISNSTGNKHTIKDLFIKLYVYQDITFDKYVYGFRTTLSYFEYSNLYLHSHLSAFQGIGDLDNINEIGCFHPYPKDSQSSVRKFCTGTDNHNLNNLYLNLLSKYSIFDLEIFLRNLNNFVRWESIEGKPYLSIDDLKNKNSSYPALTFENEVLITKLFINFINNLTKEDLINNVSIQCINGYFDFNYEELEELFIKKSNIESKNLILENYDRSYSSKVSTDYIINQLNNSEYPTFKFRGEDITFKMYDSFENTINNTKLRVHKNINLKDIFKKITNKEFFKNQKNQYDKSKNYEFYYPEGL